MTKRVRLTRERNVWVASYHLALCHKRTLGYFGIPRSARKIDVVVSDEWHIDAYRVRARRPTDEGLGLWVDLENGSDHIHVDTFGWFRIFIGTDWVYLSIELPEAES